MRSPTTYTAPRGRRTLQSEPVRRPITILMADDDEEDRELTHDALQDARLANEMRFVVDGQDLLDYLRREGVYADESVDAPRPGVILLDLNMPKKDGREALAEIKADESLRQIPVIVLTTSKDEEDIFRTYDLGVNSFITKPVTFAGLVEVMQTWTRYWFEVVDLPPAPHINGHPH
jgi:CheY-like chemotaxis protein